MRRTMWSWRDVLFDVAPVIVLLTAGLLDVALGLSPPYGQAPRWTAIAPVVVACLALLLRRRRPLLTLAVMPVGVALLAVLTPVLLTYWGQFVPWLVGMYSAGRHLPWRRGLWAIPISLGAYVLLLVSYPAMRDPDSVMFNVAILLGLWAIGRLAASWSGYRDRTVRLEFERLHAEERAAVLERTRIARELHDVIAHTITVIVMQAGGARMASAADPRAAVAALSRIEGLGRESLTELRALLDVLGSHDGAEVDRAPQPGLGDLDELCATMRTLGLPVELRVDGDLARPAAALQLTAYRVAQEGLTNVLKHAGPVATTVGVLVAAESLTIEVGNAPGGREGGMPGASRGLAGLRERVAALGGAVAAGPDGDGGFRVRAVLPLQPVPGTYPATAGEAP